MPPVRFRSTFNRVLSVVAWSGLGVLLVAVVAGGGLARPLIPLGILAIAGLVWALLWSPCIEVDDEAVTIVNVLRRVRIPWAAVIHVDTRFALTVHTPGRTFAATAAPAPGQLAGLRADRAGRAAREAAGADGTVRPGDLPTTDSGRAAALVRDRWTRLRESGAVEPGAADSTPVEAALRPVPLAALAAAAAVLVVGLLVPA